MLWLIYSYYSQPATKVLNKEKGWQDNLNRLLKTCNLNMFCRQHNVLYEPTLFMNKYRYHVIITKMYIKTKMSK